MWPLIAAGAASVLPSLIGVQGQRDTNASNESIARRATEANMGESATNRSFQAQQTTAQNAFQERMSNTAHQREAADLRAAGINPILAAQSGASTPSGSSASGSQGSAVSATMQNPFGNFGGLATNALEAMTMFGGLEKQSAETALMRAQTKKAGVDTKVAERGVPMSDMLNRGYKNILKPIIDKAEQWNQDSSWLDRAEKRLSPKPNPVQQKKEQFFPPAHLRRS